MLYIYSKWSINGIFVRDQVPFFNVKQTVFVVKCQILI